VKRDWAKGKRVREKIVKKETETEDRSRASWKETTRKEKEEEWVAIENMLEEKRNVFLDPKRANKWATKAQEEKKVYAEEERAFFEEMALIEEEDDDEGPVVVLVPTSVSVQQ